VGPAGLCCCSCSLQGVADAATVAQSRGVLLGVHAHYSSTLQQPSAPKAALVFIEMQWGGAFFPHLQQAAGVLCRSVHGSSRGSMSGGFCQSRQEFWLCCISTCYGASATAPHARDGI
jgi:hypothetical protein